MSCAALSADGLSRFNYKWAVDIHCYLLLLYISIHIYQQQQHSSYIGRTIWPSSNCWRCAGSCCLVSRTAAYIILSSPLGNRRNFVSKKTFAKMKLYYTPSVRGESYRENIFLYTDISQVCGTRQKSEISLTLSITLYVHFLLIVLDTAQDVKGLHLLGH